MSVASHHPQPSTRPTAKPFAGVLAVLALLAATPGVRGGSSTPSLVHPDEPRVLPLAQTEPSTPHVAVDDGLAVEGAAPDSRVEAELVFQGDLVSVKAVASFSRGIQMDTSDDPTPLLNAAPAPVPVAGPSSSSTTLTSAALSEMIFALQSEASASRSATLTHDEGARSHSSAGLSPRKAQRMFWEDAEDGDFIYRDPSSAELAAAVAVGARGAGGANSIPLPAAAWSAMTVLGAIGATAGARRLRRRLGY